MQGICDNNNSHFRNVCSRPEGTAKTLRHTVLNLKEKTPDEYTVSIVRRFVEEIQAYLRQLKKQAAKEKAA